MVSFRNILIQLAVFIAVILILNYFEMIPLSNIYPKLFGILPQQTTTSSYAPAAPQGSVFYPCPVKTASCPPSDMLTQSVENKLEFAGLGYRNLPSGTEVVAIFTGSFAVQQAKDDINISLRSEEKGLLATYFIKGSTTLKAAGQVSEGETLAVLSGTTQRVGKFKRWYNMVISIQDIQSAKFIKLTPFAEGISKKD